MLVQVYMVVCMPCSLVRSHFVFFFFEEISTKKRFKIFMSKILFKWVFCQHFSCEITEHIKKRMT